MIRRMRTNLVLTTIAFGAALLACPASAAELRIRTGEKRVISVRKAQGLTLDNPDIAEARILSATQIEIVGKEDGEGKILVLTADGQTLTFAIHVIGGKEIARLGEEASTDARRTPRFGGKKIANARCGEPNADTNASNLFEEARALLKKDQISEAISKLDQALKLEPEIALAHLFLGAAWAKIKDQAQGAYHYETFVLSCPDDPKVGAVVQLLRDFERRVPQKENAKHSP